MTSLWALVQLQGRVNVTLCDWGTLAATVSLLLAVSGCVLCATSHEFGASPCLRRVVNTCFAG